MKRYGSLAVLLCAAVVSSCSKDSVRDISAPLPSATARIKFFNFGVNAPGVNFYANDTKMTAISSATGSESTTGTVSGGAGANGLYSAITPGQYTVSGKIAAATDKDLAVTKVTATIADGKFYSFYMSGIYDATAKIVEGFVVEDPIPSQIDLAVAYVRFVNAISNSTPMTLYAKNTTTNAEVAVGGSVAYKAAGTFVTVPNGIYDLNTRVGASATNVITRTAVTLAGGRVYTIGSRGDITVTSTTATTRPQLDQTANR